VEIDDKARIFSIIYLLIGYGFCSGFVSITTELVINSKNWYSEALQMESLESIGDPHHHFKVPAN